MSNDRSVTMIVPAADRDAANTYAVAMNWGPIFSVALSPTGALPVTHYGSHQFETAEYVATMEAAKASADPALDGLDNLYIYAEVSTEPKFLAALADHAPALVKYEEPMEY